MKTLVIFSHVRVKCDTHMAGGQSKAGPGNALIESQETSTYSQVSAIRDVSPYNEVIQALQVLQLGEVLFSI